MSRSSVPWREVGVFVAVACGLGILVVSPLAISGVGLRHPLAQVAVMAMMFTPAVAALGTTALVAKAPDKWRQLGLGLGKGYLPHWIFALLAWPAMSFGGLVLAWLVGAYEMDLVELSGFRALLEGAGAGAVLEQTTPHALLGAQLVLLPLAGFLNAPVVLGEELGWRGFLLPRLRPLGEAPALALSGVIWGLWHAPVILMGHNYPDHPRLGVLLMVVFCVLVGSLLGWSRLRTGSIWPAVLGHGAINGSAGLVLALSKAGADPDLAWVGPAGVAGWILPAVLLGVLVGTGRIAR